MQAAAAAAFIAADTSLADRPIILRKKSAVEVTLFQENLSFVNQCQRLARLSQEMQGMLQRRIITQELHSGNKLSSLTFMQTISHASRNTASHGGWNKLRNRNNGYEVT
jgi:hypothetical protein